MNAQNAPNAQNAANAQAPSTDQRGTSGQARPTDSDRYRVPGPLTDPGPLASQLDGLPHSVADLVAVVQGLLVHVFWAERYGTTVDDSRAEALQHRSTSWKLARILELDDAPLTRPRPLETRLVGNCRDFTVLLVSLLRHRGIAARARCGFGTYFLPDHYEDHWVCEWLDEDRGEWVLTDAQLDDFQVATLGVDFDPLDVPRHRFVVAGAGWQMCRLGTADPARFGIHDMHGLWFVAGDLFRDVAALHNAETLPWDCWGPMRGWIDAIPGDDLAVLDRMAALTARSSVETTALEALYRSREEHQVPAELLR